MIRISNVKIPVEKILSQKEEIQISEIKKVLINKFKILEEDIEKIRLIKRSLDARKKENMFYIYTVDVAVSHEKLYVGKNDIIKKPKNKYVALKTGTQELKTRPIVVGMGPAGLFCALELAKAGYAPLVLERGEEVDARVKTVEEFWNGGELQEESNVQFGEGGAGTFSDGKLNTLVKDTSGRHKKVLDTFLSCGAPTDISYLNKPHIGTDKLREVVKNMRKEILRLGGEVRFQGKVTDIQIENGAVTAVVINEKERIACEVLVMAIGHSARDTFSMMYSKEVEMEAKSFAMGIRIEHPQEVIGKSQYGALYKELPAADYKVTHQASNGRGVYSFCMCPGGFVVNASSEKGRIAINGMSHYDRSEINGNSAIIVTVTPEDFQENHPLAGVAFQQKWETLAYKEGKGSIPVQRFGDFKKGQTTTELGKISPNIKGSYTLGNLKNCLPDYVSQSLIEAIESFEKKIKGFSDEDALLSGIESRTSSPVRIIRKEETLESNIKGLYPCGEGAGYAGGIISAGMDGIKVFERIGEKYGLPGTIEK
ncbi:MAG: FAD-dependent oxidoreductase [Acetivibrio sp.]